MYRRAALLLPIAALLHPAVAAEPGAAARFIGDVGHEFAATIAGTTTVEQRKAKLAPFLQRVVDVDGAARFCLGRFWREATPEQQRDYLQLFGQALVAAVAARAENYGGDRTAITVLPEAPAPDGVTVRTVVRTAGQPAVNVTWLVDTGREPFKITDVQAEGISLRQTLRSDYTSFLRRNGGDLAGFLQSLREHAG